MERKKNITQCGVCKDMGLDDCKYCPKVHPEWWTDEPKMKHDEHREKPKAPNYHNK